MRIFQTRAFARMVRKAGLGNAQLIEAINRLENGIFDADLGQKLFKQRVARQGQGKSGGFRMLVAYDRGARAVFLFGFAKSDKANLDDAELEDVRILGKAWLALPEAQIQIALRDKRLFEVERGGTTDSQETLPSET